jgi:alkyl hydroperoxide reductase subunit AhpC
MSAKVGKLAPEFETKGYVDGEIKTVKLSDYRGQWVMLYFYPGDFTFV